MIMKTSLSCRIVWFSCRLLVLFALCIFYFCSTVSSWKELLVSETIVPAIFAFGDGVRDTGNNNDLMVLLKSNFPPYGKDFEQGNPTGRFSNVQALGVKRNMPAYIDPNLQEKDLLTGVSFASTDGGFDDLASKIFFAKSMEDQLTMFEEYIGKVKELVGNEITNFIINNSIYYVEGGSNDLVVYFNIPFRTFQFDVDSYTDFELLLATSFIKKLYKLGAQKFAVNNMLPVGCTPLQRTVGGGLGRECAEEHNQAALLYNTKLAAEVEVLEATLPGSKLVYVDIYSIIIKNARNYGFKVVDKGCCRSGLMELAIMCNPVSSLCKNQNKYLF